MQPPIVTSPPFGVPAVPGMPPGAQRTSTTYYDAGGTLRYAADPVPVDQYGTITGTRYRCRQHGVQGWFPAAVAVKNPPACVRCGKRMVAMPVARPPLLPWRALWGAAERPLRPVWALAGMAAAGFAVDAAEVPALVLAGAAPLAGYGTYRAVRAVQVKAALKGGRLEHEDPGGDKRLRAAIDRAARGAGYTGFGLVAALTAAAVFGVDLSTWPGRAAAALMAVPSAIAVATWWRRERDARIRPEPVMVEAVEEPSVDLVDPDEAAVRRIWDTVLAVRTGQVVGHNPDGSPIKATANGKLPGTRLEDWERIEGGWSATIDGPIGAYESDAFVAAIGKIASAYRMKKSMITVMPDPEDENRAIVMAQRTSPINDQVRWAGPDSIDAERGIAVVGRYVDGSPLRYELYRPGWGCPHDFMCGTTGAGKSETLSGLLAVDRWAHYVDAHGVAHGLVADLLIDPQQGQSYEPFMDDLAAPVATSIDEAMLMVQAFKQEMLRRNAFLSKKGWRDGTGQLHRAEWVDRRGRTRYGRKWWNPLVDGPILTLNIDEAHEYLAVREFATLVTAGARMYRKCGMRIRVATHTPLLSDLGGSMALRDMLTGGFVWVGRTANSLSGPTAFNGRLPVDPRSIPAIPGAGFTLGQLADRPMMSRFMWEEDYYELVRDEQDRPIGFPAALPEHTLEAFGPEFRQWMQQLRAGEEWTPSGPVKVEPPVPSSAVAAVLAVLQAADGPLSTDELDSRLSEAGTPYSTRHVRDALKVLRDERGLVETAKRGTKNLHCLTAAARQQHAEEQVIADEEAALASAETADQ
jgi:hypothetical protein